MQGDWRTCYPTLSMEPDSASQGTGRELLSTIRQLLTLAFLHLAILHCRETARATEAIVAFCCAAEAVAPVR